MQFRYFCLNTHYRQKLNFTFDALSAAGTAYDRLLALLKAHSDSPTETDAKTLEGFEKDFHAAVNDDLNVPMAIGVLWKMLKLPKSKDVYRLALKNGLRFRTESGTRCRKTGRKIYPTT